MLRRILIAGARCAVAATIGIVMSIASVSAQEVAVNEKLLRYSIVGNTARELLREMETKGPPPAFGGKAYFARTEPYYTWNLEPISQGDKCSVGLFDVSVEITYTVPYWEDQSRAGKRLSGYWDKFMDNLWVHEKGHGDIAVATAVDIAKIIKGTSPASGCAALFKNIDSSVADFLKRDRRQQEYDAATQHGKTQGAFFDVGKISGR